MDMVIAYMRKERSLYLESHSYDIEINCVMVARSQYLMYIYELNSSNDATQEICFKIIFQMMMKVNTCWNALMVTIRYTLKRISISSFMKKQKFRSSSENNVRHVGSRDTSNLLLFKTTLGGTCLNGIL